MLILNLTGDWGFLTFNSSLVVCLKIVAKNTVLALKGWLCNVTEQHQVAPQQIVSCGVSGRTEKSHCCLGCRSFQVLSMCHLQSVFLSWFLELSFPNAVDNTFTKKENNMRWEITFDYRKKNPWWRYPELEAEDLSNTYLLSGCAEACAYVPHRDANSIEGLLVLSPRAEVLAKG